MKCHYQIGDEWIKGSKMAGGFVLHYNGSDTVVVEDGDEIKEFKKDSIELHIYSWMTCNRNRLARKLPPYEYIPWPLSYEAALDYQQKLMAWATENKIKWQDDWTRVLLKG